MEERCQSTAKDCSARPKWIGIDGKTYCGHCVKTQGKTSFCDEVDRLLRLKEEVGLNLVKFQEQAKGERMKHSVPLKSVKTVDHIPTKLLDVGEEA
jgi:hypothetical protein